MNMNTKLLFLSSFLLMLLLSSSQGKKGEYYEFKYPFIRKASTFTSSSSFSSSGTASDNSYDYIIVGGGTAGCPLATTLSRNFSVLLLERGGVPFSNSNVTFLRNFHIALADTSPTSASQYFVSTDGVLNARARVLGGGTSINAGFYTRASQRFIEKVGWDTRLVNKSYPWVEKQIVHRPQVAPWQVAVRDSLLDLGVSPFNGFTYDHIYGTKFGGTIYDRFGRRHTSAELLATANPQRLTVLVHATVQRVVFDTSGRMPKAIGVVFKDEKGNEHQAFLGNHPRSEVILSSGAIGTPQMMLLSGIGPKADLDKLKIPVVLDNKYVGPPKQRTPEAVQAYIRRKRDLPHEAFKGGFILEKIANPISSGELTLTNTNADDNPSVSFNYFSNPKDLKRCVDVKCDKQTTEKILNASVHANVNLVPKHPNDTKSLEQFCRDTVITIWHYHGGCHVGKVVNPEHKVIGVHRLRIVDGSTFDESPGTNPQATVMMMGR
ncbi:Protein HOTHEAD [Linum perenne]